VAVADAVADSVAGAGDGTGVDGTGAGTGDTASGVAVALPAGLALMANMPSSSAAAYARNIRGAGVPELRLAPPPPLRARATGPRYRPLVYS
jgi:hypothetical protein